MENNVPPKPCAVQNAPRQEAAVLTILSCCSLSSLVPGLHVKVGEAVNLDAYVGPHQVKGPSGPGGISL